MEKKEFIELVYEYGASGDEAFNGRSLSESQQKDIALAWSEFDKHGTEEKTDAAIGSWYKDFCADA